MIQKNWSFVLDDGEHTVKCEQSIFSKRKIRLDGKLLDSENDISAKSRFLGEGEYEFNINSHRCLVVVRNSWLTRAYDLAIDGKSITTGMPLTGIPATPKWAWAFVAFCLAIPLISGGGALPFLFGFGGAIICISIARDAAKTSVIRLALCFGVIVLAWVLFLVLIIGIAMFRS